MTDSPFHISDGVQFGGERAVPVDADDLPVQLPAINHCKGSQELDVEHCAAGHGPPSNLHHIYWIIVPLQCTGTLDCSAQPVGQPNPCSLVQQTHSLLLQPASSCRQHCKFPELMTMAAVSGQLATEIFHQLHQITAPKQQQLRLD